MKRWTIGLVLALAVGVLAGCGQEQATTAPAGGGGAGETYSSAALDTSYTDALDASSQLVLGTIRLEGTGNAVTPEQAKSLLPLWQSLQGGVTAQAEVNAVLKQIEGTMTQEQLAAIAAMQLTQEDLQSWMQEQGMGGGSAGPGGGGMPGGGQFGDMSEEDRANMRATMEAGGGGFPGGGQFGDMSEEERANMRATMEAGGGSFPGGSGGGAGMSGGRGGAGRGLFGFMLNPLIELLTRRAAE